MRAARHLSREFVRTHPADAAAVLGRLPAREAGGLLEGLPSPIAALGLQGMGSLIGAECLTTMSDQAAAAILGELRPAGAAGMLLRLATPERQRLLSLMPPETAESLRRRLRYPEGTAGALAEPRVLSFPEQITAGEALSRLQRSSRYARYYVYVVDREEQLLGVLSLRQLMLAPPEKLLGAVMEPQVARLSASAKRAAILAHPAWRRVNALPVVDSAGRIVGVLEHETLRRLEREESGRQGPVQATSFGLAFCDLYWIGMTRVLGGLAGAVLRGPRTSRGGDDARRP